MGLTSSVFAGAVLIVIGTLIALGVIVWRVARSVKIGEQLYLPFTAEDFVKLDDAVRKNRVVARHLARARWRDESPSKKGWNEDTTDRERDR